MGGGKGWPPSHLRAARRGWVTKLQRTGRGHALTYKTQEARGTWHMNDSPFPLTRDSAEIQKLQRVSLAVSHGASCVSIRLWPVQSQAPPCTGFLSFSAPLFPQAITLPPSGWHSPQHALLPGRDDSSPNLWHMEDLWKDMFWLIPKLTGLKQQPWLLHHDCESQDHKQDPAGQVLQPTWCPVVSLLVFSWLPGAKQLWWHARGLGGYT